MSQVPSKDCGSKFIELLGREYFEDKFDYISSTKKVQRMQSIKNEKYYLQRKEMKQ